MSIDVLQDNVCINRLVERKKKEILLETSVIVPDIKPDIIKAVDLSGNVCIYKKEIINGKVKIDGTIDANIIYLADGEKETIRGLNSNIDFSEFIEIETTITKADIDVSINIKNMECDVLNGRKINLKAEVVASVRLYANDGINMLKDVQGVDGIQKLNKTVQLNSMIGKNSNKVSAKENIVLNPEEKVMEILKKEINIINKDFKISYNKVLAKSEVSLNLLYLDVNENIKSINKNIPIMGFIDMENIQEDNICDVKYSIKNILVKLNNSEDNSIYFEAEVEISCYSYEAKDIELIEDIYSPFINLEYKQKNVKAMIGLKTVSDTYNIKENLMEPNIINGRVYNISTHAFISEVNITGGKATYVGEAILDVLFENAEISRIDKKELHFPINYEMGVIEGVNEENLDINIEIRKSNLVPQGDSSANVDLELNISSKMFKTINLNVIDCIEEKDFKEKGDYSIIVYFVKPGDTLWNIAKKYKSTVEDIKNVNNIADEYNLQINQQLFIPRYVSKAKAM